MLINGALWATGLEDQIRPDGEIGFVGPFRPTTFGFKGHVKNVTVDDLRSLDGAIPPTPVAAKQLNAKSDRPNVLFIMSDDHTWQAIGAYQSHLAGLNPTPNIDRLAAEGMRFNAAVCSNSICTPSRAAIMTGQYAHQNGVLTLNDRLPVERQILAHEMNAAGHQTAIIGKWHLKERPDAFDYYKVLPGQGKYFDPDFFEKGREGKQTVQGHSTDVITDKALDWLTNDRDASRPFFLKLHFKAPHDYYEYAPRYEDYLADVAIPEPSTLRHRGEGSIATRGYEGELSRVIATSIGRRNWRRSYAADFDVSESLSDDDALGEAYQIYLKKYLRCVKGVDDNLGRVVEYLRSNNLLDNTVIFYTGDQGFFLGEHDMQDKRWAYEPCMRMPLIVRYPKSIEGGVSTDVIVENIDFPATMLDFAGRDTLSEMTGRSFRSLLETGQAPDNWKRVAYYQYWMHMAHHDVPSHIGMRTARHKLILFHGESGGASWGKRANVVTPPAWELYDLKNDPLEQHNLANDPEHAELLARLQTRFSKLRNRVGANDLSGVADAKVRQRMANVNLAIENAWDADRQSAIETSAALKAELRPPG
ncbi:MAG: sulfatase [Planctomycetota bacterium]